MVSYWKTALIQRASLLLMVGWQVRCSLERGRADRQQKNRRQRIGAYLGLLINQLASQGMIACA